VLEAWQTSAEAMLGFPHLSASQKETLCRTYIAAYAVIPGNPIIRTRRNATDAIGNLIKKKTGKFSVCICFCTLDVCSF
jgi:hypothetical protein